MDDATVGILYETGRITWLERIAFRTIRMDQLTNPTKTASSVSASVVDRTLTTTQNAKVNAAVTVRGILRPLGKLVARFTNGTTSGTASVTLTYTNLGKRQITLPKLKKGTYVISVTYQGAFRIAARTVPAGLLRVR
jgi:PKD repeat protein